MIQKIEITVGKTIEAIARIQRFLLKYGSDLDNKQIERISNKTQELQETIKSVSKKP